MTLSPAEMTGKHRGNIANLRHIANLAATALSVVKDPNALSLCNEQTIDYMRQCLEKVVVSASNELSSLGDPYRKE